MDNGQTNHAKGKQIVLKRSLRRAKERRADPTLHHSPSSVACGAAASTSVGSSPLAPFQRFERTDFHLGRGPGGSARRPRRLRHDGPILPQRRIASPAPSSSCSFEEALPSHLSCCSTETAQQPAPARRRALCASRPTQVCLDHDDINSDNSNVCRRFRCRRDGIDNDEDRE
jgi:hypothetical protein